MNPATEQFAPTRLDFAIAKLFPKWAAGRLRARREFSYEAARSSRLRNSAKRLQGPEDYSAFPERLQLIREVRDLEQNFGLFQSIIDKLALYAFGRVRYQARTGNPAIDKQYEDYLEECFEHCDLTGRNDLQQMAQIAYKSQIRDGDNALKWQRDAGMLKLLGIESDRIGGNVTMSTADNYFQGIWADPFTGRPVSYDIYRRTRANSYVDKVSIPAADILFLFDPRRFDQYRGITPFAPIIPEARDLKEVLEACLQGTKFENYHAAVGYTPSGQPFSDPSTLITGNETDANGVSIKEQQLKPGMIQWAPSDSEYEFMKSDRPSGTFQTYVEMLVCLQSIALKLPVSFVWKMIGTGPAVRADLQAAHRVIEYDQGNVTKRLLNPAKNTWLVDGIAQGRIPYHPNWYRGKWQFAPAVSIDAGRDSQAKVLELNAGVRTKDSIFNESGEDAEEQEDIQEQEVDRMLARADRLAKKRGVSVEIALTLLGIRTANGFLVSSNPQTDEGDSETEDDTGENKRGEMDKTDMAKRQQVRALIARAQNRLSAMGEIRSTASRAMLRGLGN